MPTYAPPSGFDYDKGFVRDTTTGGLLTEFASGFLAGIATEATQQRRYGGGKKSVGGTLNTSGDNVVLTPPAGQAITVYWVSVIANPDDSANNLVTVKFSNGTVLYVAYALAHWEPFTAPTDGTLILNLSSNQQVGYTAHYTTA